MDIGAWLRSLGLEQYEQAFRDNAVGGEILPKLTADDLKDIGVTLVGHRRKMLDSIAALHETDEPLLSSKSGPELSPPPSQAERRQLTVMFVDLVGSTALARRLDPEEMSQVLRGYQDAVARVVARFEGHVAKFMGDGVLAVFGWPRAQEDAAERAVWAGLAIATSFGDLAAPSGSPLVARVGIATGLVVVATWWAMARLRRRRWLGKPPTSPHACNKARSRERS
jgi:class 3 adenylate cyclase